MAEALIVVAHHDDHTLWIGGTIQRMRRHGWNWGVIAMCVPHQDRKNYFCTSCTALGVQGCWMEFRDYQTLPATGANQLYEMESRLAEAVQGKSFDWVFTHSRAPYGEYGGHANHDEVRKAVESLVTNGRMRAAQVAHFSYEPIYAIGKGATAASLDAHFWLHLTSGEWRLKRDLCNQIPDQGSLAGLAWPCPNPEAFDGDNLRLPEPFVDNARRK